MYVFRRWWERYGVQTVLAVLALVAAGLVRHTNGAVLFEMYQALARPFEANPAQQEQLVNARIRELEQRLAEQERQNQSLKQLVGAVGDRDRQPIFAPAIGRSAHHWWNHIILGRGRRDGLKKGYIVTAPGGLVGRISSVTDRTSRVLLISDPTSRVGVTIGRSRSMGFLRGQGTERAVMEFFDKVPDVKAGDTVSTSSLSQLFPPGTPVGSVESVKLNASPAPEATVKLSAPIGNLEWALVEPNRPISETSSDTTLDAEEQPQEEREDGFEEN
ncbi:rod shape-determining protein MreC [Oscillatoriales cyanobacterium LEGE 11467]|uniref:Cell shape-determining protein MreC n=1 Tax=Zarconia navalis LEGE 11467 TaxID=1828826 RepID=A0A928VWR4_9CYAN|nr:rod shape-determining protein MreC [Zarconia navalis LEGE 11467]